MSSLHGSKASISRSAVAGRPGVTLLRPAADAPCTLRRSDHSQAHHHPVPPVLVARDQQRVDAAVLPKKGELSADTATQAIEDKAIARRRAGKTFGQMESVGKV